MLTSGSGAAIGVNPNVLFVDVDFDVFGKLGDNVDAGKACLALAVGVIGADADQPVDSALDLEVTIGILALDEQGCLFYAGFGIGLNVEHFYCPALGFGVAHIHAHEHVGPVLCIQAACPGVDFQNRVVYIVLV